MFKGTIRPQPTRKGYYIECEDSELQSLLDNKKEGAPITILIHKCKVWMSSNVNTFLGDAVTKDKKHIEISGIVRYSFEKEKYVIDLREGDSIGDYRYQPSSSIEFDIIETESRYTI